MRVFAGANKDSRGEEKEWRSEEEEEEDLEGGRHDQCSRRYYRYHGTPSLA